MLLSMMSFRASFESVGMVEDLCLEEEDGSGTKDLD